MLRFLDREPAARVAPAPTQKFAGQADRSERAAAIIDELLARYQASRLLDDKRYARALATSLRARGSSRRSIIGKLCARGVPAALARTALEAVDTEAVETETADAELTAAIALVRKRRLGPHRPESERETEQRRDLNRLARAGFSFDVARRALRADEVDDVFRGLTSLRAEARGFVALARWFLRCIWSTARLASSMTADGDANGAPL